MGTLSFREYATPSSHLAYSEQFFEIQTISQALSLLASYPTILPVGSVVNWNFSCWTPSDASSTVMLSGEVIPNIQDLQRITATMESAYNNEAIESLPCAPTPASSIISKPLIPLPFKHSTKAHSRQE
ncbi:hypothetical protein DXG01_011525 [Tephrocybe rancida]|nr:hypothetical protein DXG01_011525 [Tephrocybe rancida]